MADENEDEGKEDGWVNSYFGYGEGFEGRHCGFEESLKLLEYDPESAQRMFI